MINRDRQIYKTTIIGSVGNFILVVIKFIAGIFGHSSALIADAIHSISDFITDVIVLIFTKISSKPRDCDHHYGHGKYETLATAIIGLSLIVVGAMILGNGCEKIYHYIQGQELEEPGMLALIVAIASIVVKEAMYRYTVAVGKRLNSQIVIANAWHHRSDAFSSIATAIGVGGAIAFGVKWRVLDPIAAILVSIMIIKVAVELILPSINELLEKSLPRDVEKKILNIVNQFPQVSEPHNLRTRQIGPTRSIEMHVRMQPDLTVKQSHDITREIEQALRAAIGADTFINIHVEPMKENTI